jgi:hypothetical protein
MKVDGKTIEGRKIKLELAKVSALPEEQKNGNADNTTAN